MGSRGSRRSTQYSTGVGRLGGIRYQILNIINKQYFVRVFQPPSCKLYKYSRIQKNALQMPSLLHMHNKCIFNTCKSFLHRYVTCEKGDIYQLDKVAPLVTYPPCANSNHLQTPPPPYIAQTY